MKNELLEQSDERIAALFANVDKLRKSLAAIKKNNAKRTFINEIFITDKELSERLRLSRRTLQEYRDMGRLPYYQLGGKILYKESDVQKVLDSCYRRGFDFE